MKPDWDLLSKEYEGSDKVLIGDVDCTAEFNEKLCERFGVDGYPTIKFFNHPDTDGEIYDGGRELEDLKEFALTLGPGCNVDMPENCSDEEKMALDEVLGLSEADRDAELKKYSAEVQSVTDAHDTLLERLQAEYEESEKKKDERLKELKTRIKILKSATPATPPDASKQEL